MDTPLPGSQDRDSIRARDNQAKAKAARLDLYARRYPEEARFYAAIGLPTPTPPTRHDRERIARERTVAPRLRGPHTAAHEPGQDVTEEAA